MRDTFPLLDKTDFPPIRRERLTTLQANLGYRCNQSSLPPDKVALEAAYKEQLAMRHGIVFNHLFALANMPIQRFGSTLVTRGEFHDYMRLLKNPHRADNLPGVMCRTTIPISWKGHVHDCDFNQMLGLPLAPFPFHQISETTV